MCAFAPAGKRAVSQQDLQGIVSVGWSSCEDLGQKLECWRICNDADDEMNRSCKSVQMSLWHVVHRAIWLWEQLSEKKFGKHGAREFQEWQTHVQRINACMGIMLAF